MKKKIKVIIKTNYIVFPAIAITISWLRNIIIRMGMNWDKTLKLPPLIPPNWIFPLIWNTIFVCTTLSAMIIWNNFKGTRNFNRIIGLFVMNAFLNVLWPYLFFYRHLIGAATISTLFLGITIYGLVFYIWPKSYHAAYLLFPYAIWVTFATFLNFQIWLKNVSTLQWYG